MDSFELPNYPVYRIALQKRGGRKIAPSPNLLIENNNFVVSELMSYITLDADLKVWSGDVLVLAARAEV